MARNRRVKKPRQFTRCAAEIARLISNHSRAPLARTVVMKPKKPKKIAAVKPRSSRTTAAKSKPRAKTTTQKTVAKSRAVAKPKKKTATRKKAVAVIEPKTVIEEQSVVAPETKPESKLARKTPLKIPAILLEGDKPEAPPISGPGQRYALGPTAPVEKLETEGELPESYGTQQLLLTARDPHWLYAHWDLSREQQRHYNAFSRDGHLVVRVYTGVVGGKPAAEVHVHPESRHWFVHVPDAGTKYIAELGYYSAADKWTTVSTSTATLTPPDAVSADTSEAFGTIPFEVPMEKLLSLVKEAVQENVPLAQALQELREEHPDLPELISTGAAPSPGEWTPAQQRALAEVISMDHVRRVWMGSLEITELIRRQFIQELASMSTAEIGAVAPGAPTSPAGALAGISSPHGKTEQPKGFWFNVNAELIVYGATETDATVTIGGRKIKLRPDGSFSYRFALPDGKFEMPVVAISADQTDGRAAEMKFSRGTEYRGDVGAHPQDPALRQLTLENF
jgi:hypothetical protein